MLELKNAFFAVDYIHSKSTSFNSLKGKICSIFYFSSTKKSFPMFLMGWNFRYWFNDLFVYTVHKEIVMTHLLRVSLVYLLDWKLKCLAPTNCSVSVIVTCPDRDWPLTLCYRLFTPWLMYIKTIKMLRLDLWLLLCATAYFKEIWTTCWLLFPLRYLTW